MAGDKQYPRYLYCEDGRTRVVHSEDEEAGLGIEWVREPFEIHRQPLRVQSTAPDGISEQEALAEMIARRVVAMLDERSAEPVKRGPGRPPLNRSN